MKRILLSLVVTACMLATFACERRGGVGGDNNTGPIRVGYYGDLTGLCWVQGFNKVYTAYGGQVHIFSTADNSEIDNKNVTVQGTALDVAYMDAVTDADN